MTDLICGPGLKSYKRRQPWLLLVVLMLTACQGPGIYRGYDGAAMPADKVARVSVPEQFDLLYIDGEQYDASVLTDGARLELLPGKHSLVIQYDELWDITVDDHDRITSQPVMLNFSIRPGRNYVLQSRPLKDVADARAYARRPVVQLIDRHSRQGVPVKYKYRLGDKKYLAGFTADAPVSAESEQADKAPQMLEYWWNQADSGQQQRFLNWAKAHGKTRE